MTYLGVIWKFVERYLVQIWLLIHGHIQVGHTGVGTVMNW